MQGVEAHAVDQVGRGLDVPDRQVAIHAGLQAPQALMAAQRPRGFAGEAGDAFVHGHAEQGGGHVHRQQRAGQRRGAGVAVGGQRQWHAGFAQLRDRRHGGVAGEVERARQQHRDGAGGAHRGDAGRIQMLDVVGRQRAMLRGQFGTVLVAHLLGVDLQRQPVRTGRLEYLRGLFAGEGDVLAEHVHRFGQAFGGDGRDHYFADLVDVVLRLASRRHRVRAEEGGHDFDLAQLLQLFGHAQLLALVVQGQAVAGLDLDGGHAFAQHRVQPRQAGGEQGGIVGGAGGAHGGNDAAAGAGDVGIADALQALLELVGAVAGMNQVGVAVDQAGADPAPAAVDALRGVEGRRTGGRAGMHDAPCMRGDDAVADDAEAAAGVVECHQVGVMPNRIAVHAHPSQLFCIYNNQLQRRVSSDRQPVFADDPLPCRAGAVAAGLGA